MSSEVIQDRDVSAGYLATAGTKNVPLGFKRTDIGVIPEDWDVKSLADVCIPGGIVRGPFGGALKKEVFVERGFKVYEQRNAIYKSCEIGSYFINDAKYTEMQRFAISPGDFIVSCSGTIGRIYQIPPDAPSGVINQALLKLTTSASIVDDHYFYILFEWGDFQTRIIDSTQGGAMKNLVGMDIFKTTPVVAPSLPEQRAIAEALSNVDGMLGALDELIAKKHGIKQGAMQQLLTGKTRLPGFNGEWVTVSMAKHASLNARIGWQALTTAEYMDSGTYYLVTGTDFVNGRVNWSTCHFVDEWRYNQDSNIQLRDGDVLLTKDGTIGKVGYVDSLSGPATLNSGVFVIRPLADSFVPQFLFYVLTSRIFDDFLSKITAGSTITHLYQKDFITFEFLAPTPDEQTAIAKVLSDMDVEIEALEARRDKTREIKQGMMQQLLTGRVRLLKPGQQATSAC